MTLIRAVLCKDDENSCRLVLLACFDTAFLLPFWLVYLAVEYSDSFSSSPLSSPADSWTFSKSGSSPAEFYLLIFKLMMPFS